MKEIRYAALLHDFGKVGVREHVLVKAEKLYPNEVALLKARFEFVKRTLEKEALERKVSVYQFSNPGETAELLAKLDKELGHRLDDTDEILRFLLACNVPTVLAKGGFVRLNEIAAKTIHSFDRPTASLTAPAPGRPSIPTDILPNT